MAASGAADKADDSLYPIAVLIDELKNEDIQVIWRAQTFDRIYDAINISLTSTDGILLYSCD